MTMRTASYSYSCLWHLRKSKSEHTKPSLSRAQIAAFVVAVSSRTFLTGLFLPALAITF